MSPISLTALWAVLFLSHIASACMPDGATNSITQATDTYVCIVLSPLTWGYNSTTQAGGKYLRIPSKLSTDSLARIKVPNSWTSADYAADATTTALRVTTSSQMSTGVGVSVSSMGVTSYQKAYRINDLSAASDAQRTFPMLFAIIAVDNGKVIVRAQPAATTRDSLKLSNLYMFSLTLSNSFSFSLFFSTPAPFLAECHVGRHVQMVPKELRLRLQHVRL